MPKETFFRTVSLAVSPPRAWSTITDVPALVSRVSLLQNAQTISDLHQYTAVLRDKLGMFSLKADLDIVVVDYDQPRSITIRAEGEDRQVKSRIVVEAHVDLLEQTNVSGTQLKVNGSYEVSGRVATLGAGVIRSKATHILNEFFDSIERELG